MTVTRRSALKLGGLSLAAMTASACSAVGQRLATGSLPESVTTGFTADPAAAVARRLLDRAGYGPRPGDVARVLDVGLEAYLEEQLHPESINDTATDLLVRGLSYYHLDLGQLVSWDRRDVTRDLVRSGFMRALVSRRQLYEAMVEFWSDHFNIYAQKSKRFVYHKVIDDREVIRPHALGKFRDLLFASARSPAMLIYLDNVRNTASAPNENYARELMELHTVGINGGYTQRDVEELSRVLTGWGVARRGRMQGQFKFDEDAHDAGAKTVMGHYFPAGRGEEEVLEFLEILVTHPSTASFIATKLVRRFVADEPPAALVARVADTFRATDGDIKSILRTLFLSDEFAAAPPKLKRPYTYLISALRVLHADVNPHGYRQLGNWLRNLGQIPFHWPMPDGYPDEAAAWANTLLPRWNFALALLNGNLEGVNLPLIDLAESGGASDIASAMVFYAGLILGQSPPAPLVDYLGGAGDKGPEARQRQKETLALLLASPEFQWA